MQLPHGFELLSSSSVEATGGAMATGTLYEESLDAKESEAVEFVG